MDFEPKLASRISRHARAASPMVIVRWDLGHVWGFASPVVRTTAAGTWLVDRLPAPRIQRKFGEASPATPSTVVPVLLAGCYEHMWEYRLIGDFLQRDKAYWSRLRLSCIWKPRSIDGAGTTLCKVGAPSGVEPKMGHCSGADAGPPSQRVTEHRQCIQVASGSQKALLAICDVTPTPERHRDRGHYDRHPPEPGPEPQLACGDDHQNMGYEYDSGCSWSSTVVDVYMHC